MLAAKMGVNEDFEDVKDLQQKREFLKKEYRRRYEYSQGRANLQPVQDRIIKISEILEKIKG